MVCRHCYTLNPAENKYCKECGARLERAGAASAGPEPSVAAQVSELLDRAFAASEQDALEDAILACKAALVLHPESATAHSLLASLYERRNNIPAAITELEAVLAYNPESEADREKLAQLKGVTYRSPVPFRITSTRAIWKQERLPALAALATTLVVLLIGSFFYMRGAASEKPSAATGVPAPGYPSYTWSPGYQGYYPYNAGAGTAPPSYGIPEGQPSGEAMQPPPSSEGGVYRIGQEEPAVQRPAPGPPPDRSLPPIPPMPIASAVGGQLQERPISLPPAARGHASAPRARASGLPQIEISTSPATTQPKPLPLPPSPDSGSTGNGGSDEAIARRYQSAGNYEGALTAYRNALVRSSDPGPIHQHIGICLQRLNRFSEARDTYRQAIEVYQARIAAGKNVEEARHAIQSCEAAIAVCEGR